MQSLLDQITTMDENYKKVLEPYLISIFGTIEEAEAQADKYVLEEWPPAVGLEEVPHDRNQYLIRFTQTFKLRRRTPEELESKKAAEGNSVKTV